MRIPHHRQHQAPVAYLQPTNNNAIISHHNTLSDTTVNSTISSSSLLTSSILTGRTTAPTSTINHYSLQFESSNENGNGNGNESTIESITTTYGAVIPSTEGLISQNDNVNLLFSTTTTTSTTNYNQVRKYPLANLNRYQDHQVLNRNCLNLNQNIQNTNTSSDSLNCWPNSEILSKEAELTKSVRTNNLNLLTNKSVGHNVKTDPIRIQNFILNNGNNNDVDDGSRITNTQDIYEGNLNLLITEQDNIQTTHRIVTPASNVPGKLQQNHFDFTLESHKAISDENQDSEDEYIVEHNNKNAECNLEKDFEENNDDDDDVEDDDDIDFHEVEVEDNKTNQSLLNRNDIKVNNINKDTLSSDLQTECDSRNTNNPIPKSNTSPVEQLLPSQTTTGASYTEYRYLNSNQVACDEGHTDISTELARHSLAKLDLDINFRDFGEPKKHQEQSDTEEEQQERLQEDEHNQHLNNHRNHSNRHRGNYQRHQDNSVSSNSVESSPDDSLIDDDDAFSETPSSCTSLDSPQPRHYPRGIINPNYPGFQHLAHTLSEHFVNHHLDQDDSDISEFEVELSVESLDESFSSYHQRNNDLINNSENNNNQDIEDDSLHENTEKDREHISRCSLMDSMHDDISEILDLNFGSNAIKDNHRENDMNGTQLRKEHGIKSNCTKIQEIPNTETILSVFSEELCCDLDTYLKKFETVKHIKMLETPNIVEDATRNCPTPDILIKNDKKSCRKKNTSTASVENRPDLLRNVSPNPDGCSSDEKKPRISVLDDVQIDSKRISVPDNIQIGLKTHAADKHDDLNSFSMTPVDIIGDFGREVEHEFGLIVSGYNSSLIGRNSLCGDMSKSSFVDSAFEKMTDAALSECKEAISVGTNLSLSGKSLIHVAGTYGCTTCDLVKTSTPPSSATSPLTDEAQKRLAANASVSCKQSPTIVVEESKPEIPLASSPFSARSRNSANQANDDDGGHTTRQPPQSDTMLTNENSNENCIFSGSADPPTPASPTIQEFSPEAPTIVASDHGSTNNSPPLPTGAGNVEKRIPTAIVKPKYQKPSYDERQLPPIGLAYSSDQPSTRSWFASKPARNNSHPPTAAATIVTNANLVQTGDSRSRKTTQFSGHSDRDRTVKNAKKSIGRFSASVISRAEKLSGSSNARKDTTILSNSCVAIVNPRKKEKMENCVRVGENGDKRVTVSGSVGRNVVFEKNNNNNNNIKCKKGSFNNNRKERSMNSASFDVYNIETALPVIDLEAIENHLKKAKEEEKKRRNDREEIRRRLAMGAEDDYFSKIVNQDRPGRKPSLQSRLQNGMNLQICFMNEASSDTESPSSDSETCPKLSKSTSNSSAMSRYSSLSLMSSSSDRNPYNSRPLSVNIITNNYTNNNTTNLITNTMSNNKTINNNSNTNKTMINNKKFNNQINRPSTLSLGPPVSNDDVEVDFFTKQARLQIEARMALAQAKDMAHMQMEIERQKQKSSPITEVIRNSMEKVGVPFPPEKRRVSRQMLTDMNIAQLQIIVNDLHSQIERLNEQLVQYLMERDDLHMGQDSMLVDIEDLTRYLGAKEQSKLNGKASFLSSELSNDFTNQNHHTINSSTSIQNGGVQSHNTFLRIANLVKK